MIDFLTCIAVDHDPVYTVLAALACVIGAAVTVGVNARATATRGYRHALWVFLAGLVGGATVWTTHFVAMLGYRTDLIDGYDPALTALSLGLAVAGSAAGAHAAIGRWSHAPALGGLIAGLGAGAMHYVGASAMRISGTIEWSGTGIALSLVLGASLFCASALRAREGTASSRLQAALLMAGGILSLHFMGMGSMAVDPGAAVADATSSIPNGVLAGFILAMSGTLAAMAAATFMIDYDSERTAKSHFRYLALHDELTGLPNRACVRARVEELAADPVALGRQIAGVLFDLDRFKEVNDVHGHAAGDHVLRAIAERISAAMADGEFVGRFGGDEFVAIKVPVSGREEAARFAEKIRHLVAQPIQWRDVVLSVGASVGLVVYPEDGLSPTVLLQRADAAMYAAKQAGRNNVTTFQPDMEETARMRSELVMDLKRAVFNRELSLAYQQQNDTVTEEVVGFEALLRWSHPKHGNVSPAVFIPIAEEDGLIGSIGEWVLREACREAASWRKPLRIAVNVAPSQLSSTELPALVHSILIETGLKASRLELEVTETGIIADQQLALHVIRQLKALGVRIAMDDYGTGYSSLSMLQRFPFDKIKIDREFTSAIGTAPEAEAIILATVALGRALGRPVLAEGVETAAQLAFLRKAGCREVQGFLFGMPTGRAGAARIAGIRRPASRLRAADAALMPAIQSVA
ncbi:putative bifunctional diguanylate cyclase/phosphodiesterase [Mesorhizobium australicum]|uniref:Diguanylate cyclase/phosphodiesterase n=1 Tax=Mesorhizobium australicum TaxID=536018 RepID=A0A1X7MZZ3_9HYPH|nr:EAL domain-containing protein [Mesorhizobium australicum]SMH30514.1 diguanylate cyclase/phosphodiesterase [Mesorhizobium australicum]